MVLFILFPGFDSPSKFWKYDIIKNKDGSYQLKKLNFYDELKKIGKVYRYTPKVYNINHYDTGGNPGFDDWQNIYQGLFKKPRMITLDDIDIDRECKRIYNKLKNRKEKFIPIGHSIGSWFALHFSNLYPDKCLQVIFLDGTAINPKAVAGYKEKSEKTDISEITNSNLKSLYNNMLENVIEDKKSSFNPNLNKYSNKILEIASSYYFRIIEKELNGTVKVPVLSFRNLSYDIETNDMKATKNNMRKVTNEEELYQINNSKVTTYYMINSTHYPWRIQRYSDMIIDIIKKYRYERKYLKNK
tara:strand:- start:1288 stop:2190 length:903 start_codon:yes stop_codon:yes gene_type:complete